MIIVGILAVAIFPALTAYRVQKYDTLRSSHTRAISTALMSYQIDNGQYPAAISSGCIPATDINTYLQTRQLTDPAKSLTPGCDGSDGQTYAYRTGTGSDGQAYYVLGAQMENPKG